jgi:hypothetical protein
LVVADRAVLNAGETMALQGEGRHSGSMVGDSEEPEVQSPLKKTPTPEHGVAGEAAGPTGAWTYRWMWIRPDRPVSERRRCIPLSLKPRI